MSAPKTLPDFCAMLCCPSCRGDLERPAEDELHCAPCGHTYPIVEGIPVLFPTDVKSRMTELFGRYWDSEEKAEVYDTKVEGEDDPIFGVYNHESEVWALVQQYDPAKMGMVLDAGCGNGRFLDTLPDSTVKVGLDASLNLLKRVKRRGRGDFLVCAELEHIPFKDELFDTVISCRVVQHLVKQEEAVHEMSRVTKPGGDLTLELYNTWNLKTIYKNIRMSPTLRKIFNAPFRLVFKSMSPFDKWGINYDNYNGWFQVKRWMRRAGISGFTGRGAGFGYHKYFFVPFYVNAVLNKHAPGLARKYFAACFAVERALGAIPPMRWTWEKLIIRGTKEGRYSGSGATAPVTPSTPSIPERVGNKVRHVAKSSAFYNREARRELARELAGRDATADDDRRHLTEALGWLRRAQDATPDRGVSRAYSLGWSPYFDLKGWQPSYPETTGYIVPTFYDCAEALGDDDLRRRAVEMADWEIEVQLASGAVRGGTIAHPASPAVFNTGQVMLGWLRAHEETGEPRFLEASARAARYLIANQEPDGSWIKGNSRYAKGSATTYNARVGWALILHGLAAGDDEAIEAGRRNLDHTVERQIDSGWFRDNCLDDPDAPLTHTFSYVLEGLLGGYDALGETRWLDAVRRAADGVLPAIADDGRLAGRLDASFGARAPWVCLTGSSQLAAVLLRLAARDGAAGAAYRDAALRLLRFVKRTQNLVTDDPGLRGGIKGSHPIDGGYGRFELLNWAAKFFADALLLAEHAVRAKPRDAARATA